MEAFPPDEDRCEELAYYQFRPPHAEKLKQSVEKAFADVAYPGDGDRDIIVSGSPDCCAECGETHALFHGKHWREFADAGIPLQQQGWGGLALLTPQAWRFYLPAYLLVSLSGGDEAENALDCALGALTPWPAEGLSKLGGGVIDYVKMHSDWFADRAFGFSVAQMECLAVYVCAAHLSDPENKDWAALAIYWKDRASSGLDQAGG